MPTPISTCAPAARSGSVQSLSAPIATSPAAPITPIGFGVMMGAVLLGVLGFRLYRQYRAKVLLQQVARLERLWRKPALEENSF
jgi:hypothetical protein